MGMPLAKISAILKIITGGGGHDGAVVRDRGVVPVHKVICVSRDGIVQRCGAKRHAGRVTSKGEVGCEGRGCDVKLLCVGDILSSSRVMGVVL